MEQISFVTADGSRLAGSLFLPNGKGTVKMAILLHGWGSNRQTARNNQIADDLNCEGIGALSFDFRGHGQSEGDLSAVNIFSQVEDVKAAYDYLTTVPRADLKGGVGIVGASIGGTTAFYAMTAFPHLFRCGVLICPRLDFDGVAEDMYFTGEGESRVENRMMLVTGLSIDFYAASELVKNSVLIIHGTNDQTIPIEQSRKLASLSPKRFELQEIQGGDHRMVPQTKLVAKSASGFLADYLGA